MHATAHEQFFFIFPFSFSVSLLVFALSFPRLDPNMSGLLAFKVVGTFPRQDPS